MTTDALIGSGGKFEIKEHDDADFVEIPEVIGITPPSDTIDVLEATHFGSPVQTREYILGLNDPGNADVTMNFIPGGPGDLKIQQVRSRRRVVDARITYPSVGDASAVTWTFQGILVGYEPDMPIDDKMTAVVSFKVTGSYVTGVAA
ncbi:MAG: phage tail tube protein [Pseudomonadota bacterium]